MEPTPSKKNTLRVLLALGCLTMTIYTYFTVKIDGWNFFAAAIEYLQSMLWKGQFSLDFFSYLFLSALWVSWRNKFSLNSIPTTLLALIGGFIFFSLYLIYLITKEEGDMKKVLLGKHY